MEFLTMKSLLLLDADIIIHLFEFGFWDAVISHYEVYVVSTVIKTEVIHYYPNGDYRNEKKIPVDLSDYVAKSKISEVEATVQEQSDILLRLNPVGLDGLDPGELECIAVMANDKVLDAKFCVKDTLAIKALVFLGIREKSMSLEEALRGCGVLRKSDKIPFEFSKKKFEDIIIQERLNHI